MLFSTNGIRKISRAFGGQFSLHQPGLNLYSQDSTDRLVNSRLSNGSGFDLLNHVVKQRAPIFWHHDHVDAGVNGLNTVIRLAPRHLADTIPITDNKPVKP